ncbi:glycoside hydrolase family 71 protein [Collimonas antrihumi]|uniref:glycoside hydrolase family 71 protein n=1 Tax=Collimonas antrihumi TaxID=1940615 RepID=UPI001B8AB7C9|nr:glycoside hydrolase family 71 protein [Collimonas antrihumi]
MIYFPSFHRFSTYITITLFVLGMGATPIVNTAPAELDVNTWQQVKADAERFVQLESPKAVHPFERHTPTLNSQKKVIAHYFPTFPLSLDNQPTENDYYARNYLKRSGENRKFAAQGGYLRERPLPTVVWPANRAAETNLAIEVLRAEAIGIDAFGIDLLEIREGRQWTTALTLLNVTQQVSKTFRIVPEPDMSALNNVTGADLEDALATFYLHPASFHVADGRLLVIPFKAEARPVEFWKTLITNLAKRGTPIALIPDFLNPSSANVFAPFSDGITLWGGRDPASADSYLRLASNISSLGYKTLMIPVAPQDFRPKSSSAWEARNSEAFRRQWAAAIDSHATYAHLLTWNDYSEATEISPSSGTQFFFYDLTAYFVEWFKSGSAPAITEDVLYFSHRRQLFDPHAAELGSSIRLVGDTPFVNDIEVVAMLTKPGDLEIESGGKRTRLHVNAGLNVLRALAAAGKPTFTLSRRGRTILRRVSDWNIDPLPTKEDALYVGGSTSRRFVSVSEVTE